MNETIYYNENKRTDNPYDAMIEYSLIHNRIYFMNKRGEWIEVSEEACMRFHEFANLGLSDTMQTIANAVDLLLTDLDLAFLPKNEEDVETLGECLGKKEFTDRFETYYKLNGLVYCVTDDKRLKLHYCKLY